MQTYTENVDRGLLNSPARLLIDCLERKSIWIMVIQTAVTLAVIGMLAASVLV
jgi:hypothetical protein